MQAAAVREGCRNSNTVNTRADKTMTREEEDLLALGLISGFVEQSRRIKLVALTSIAIVPIIGTKNKNKNKT